MADAASCGIMPNEFWTLTMRELDIIMRGKSKELRNLQYIAAWHISYVLNSFSKGSRITPQRLMGDEKKTYTKNNYDPNEFRKNATEQWFFGGK